MFTEESQMSRADPWYFSLVLLVAVLKMMKKENR